MKGDRERCLEAGMDGYVSKPVRKQELYDAIKPLLSRPGREFANQTAIDWGAVLDAACGAQEMVAEFVRIAIDELTTLSNELQEAINKTDMPCVRRSAHTIKGTVRIFKDARIEELAGQIEEMGRREVLDGVEPLRDALATEISRFVTTLREYVAGNAEN